MLDCSPFCDTGQSVRERRRKVDLSSAGEVVRLVKFYFSVEVITGLLVRLLKNTGQKTGQKFGKYRTYPDIHSACAS